MWYSDVHISVNYLCLFSSISVVSCVYDGCSTTMSAVDFERRLEGGRGVEIWVMELWDVFHSSLLNP